MVTYASALAEVVSCRNLHRYQSFGRKQRTYYEIPAFSLENIWRGASEIIYRFDFAVGQVGLLKNFMSGPIPGANFCPVLAWNIGEAFIRYKLWKNVGELVWIPDYNNQPITASEFFIEIWNTPNNPIVLPQAIRIYTTKMVIPADCCDVGDILLGTPTTCIDPIYHLEEFVPLFGHAFILVPPCERVLIKGAVSKPESNVIQDYIDGTWHEVWIEEAFGSMIIHVAQEDSPPGPKPYFPMTLGLQGKTYKVQLERAPGSVVSHHMFVGEEVDEVGRYITLLQTLVAPSDSNLFGVFLREEFGNKTLYVHQSPIPL